MKILRGYPLSSMYYILLNNLIKQNYRTVPCAEESEEIYEKKTFKHHTGAVHGAYADAGYGDGWND